MCLTVLLVLTVATLIAGQFTNPARYQRELWRIGDVEEIEFNEPQFSQYTVALWQQSTSQGAANMGPIIFQTSKAGFTSFDWVVQIYDFDLDESNVFFLWMFGGGPSMQGNQSSTQKLSSSFFNITSEPETTSTTSAEPTDSTKDTSDTSVSGAPPTLPTSTSENGQDTASSAPGELSTGAKAGVGVGVGVGGLCSIASVILLWKYLKKKKSFAVANDQVQEWKPPSEYWNQRYEEGQYPRGQCGRDMPNRTTTPAELD